MCSKINKDTPEFLSSPELKIAENNLKSEKPSLLTQYIKYVKLRDGIVNKIDFTFKYIKRIFVN